MRENHLETDQFPEAVFTLSSLELPPDGLQVGQRAAVDVAGTLSLHGVERKISPTVHLTRTTSGEGEALRIEAEFSVLLEDYDISRPKFLLLKLSREQHVTVDILALPADSAALVPAQSSK
jgi:polyisoprenoid-binding protein YceI